eukprot:21705-Rhodomonas_salina.1
MGYDPMMPMGYAPYPSPMPCPVSPYAIMPLGCATLPYALAGMGIGYLATPCLVLKHGMRLRARYGNSGTDVGYGATRAMGMPMGMPMGMAGTATPMGTVLVTVLRLRYAVSGTDAGYLLPGDAHGFVPQMQQPLWNGSA